MEKSEKKQDSIEDKKSQAPECVEKKRTWGNIIYDFGIFGSIAWAGVAILSAVSAHEAIHGNNKHFDWLRTLNTKVYDGAKNWLGKGLLKNSPQDIVEGYAKGASMFLTLGMGGNALAGVLKWGEDNRQSNAAVIDKVLGTTPPDPETIKAEPKQTWKSVMTGRLASYGASFLAFLAMGPRLTDKISKKFGDVATDAWMKMRPQSDHTRVRRWADIAAFDATFTAITALLTYGLSRYVAGHSEPKPAAIAHASEPAPVESPAAEERDAPEPRYASRFTSNRDPQHPEKTRFGHNVLSTAGLQAQTAL